MILNEKAALGVIFVAQSSLLGHCYRLHDWMKSNLSYTFCAFLFMTIGGGGGSCGVLGFKKAEKK